MQALPQVFNLIRILADQPRAQVLFESGDHGLRLIVVARRADAIESRFRSRHFEEYPTIVGTPVGDDHLGVGDLESGESRGTLGGLLRGGQRKGWRGE